MSATKKVNARARSRSRPPRVDDFAAGPATSGVLSIPGSLNGRVEARNDRDWFRLALTAGRTYQFRLNRITLRDPYLRLLNSGGSVITADNNSGGSRNSLITFSPSSSGTYYLEAASFKTRKTGTYTVSALSTVSAVDDYVASSATTAVLTIPGSLNGDVEANGDRDWFRLNLTAGQSYQFRQTKGSLADPLLRLRNSNGDQIISDDDSGGSLNSLITFTPSSSGLYYLDAGAFGSGKGTYTVSALATGLTSPADDYVASSATTAVLAIPGSLNGDVEANGDRDWFRLNLTAGQSYQFRQTKGSLADPLLRLRNSNGDQIISDDDSGGSLNSLITFAPSSSGLYYLDAGAFGSGKGTYTISAALTGSLAPIDDYAGSSATTGVLASPGSLSGTVEVSSDRDWFRLNLTADQTYEFALTGITLKDPFLRLRNSAGDQVAFDDSSSVGSSKSAIVFTPPSSGTYYLDAGTRFDSGSGTYTVAVALGRNGCIDADPDFADQMLALYDQTTTLSSPDGPDDPNDPLDGRFLLSEEIVEGRLYQRVFLGTSSDDEILGTDGPDILIPGEGSDRLLGGGGADIFFIRKEIWSDEIDLKNRIGDFNQAEGDVILLGQDLFDEITGFSLRQGSGINNPTSRPKVSKQPRVTFPAVGPDGTNDGWETLFIEALPGQTSVEDKDAIAYIFVGNGSFDVGSVFLLC